MAEQERENETPENKKLENEVASEGADPQTQKRTAADGPAVVVGSEEARCLAAAVLEVLGGVIGAQDAATALGVEVPRYYQLEKRALAGLVAGCEPATPGRSAKPDLERDLKAAEEEIQRLEKEVMRFEALARAAAMASGFNGEKAQAKRTKPRRKTAPRAVKVSKSLRRKR